MTAPTPEELWRKRGLMADEEFEELISDCPEDGEDGPVGLMIQEARTARLALLAAADEIERLRAEVEVTTLEARGAIEQAETAAEYKTRTLRDALNAQVKWPAIADPERFAIMLREQTLGQEHDRLRAELAEAEDACHEARSALSWGLLTLGTTRHDVAAARRQMQRAHDRLLARVRDSAPQRAVQEAAGGEGAGDPEE